MDIAFGPVPSRRLGRSLGINNIQPKHCSYSCIHCQVGPTARPEIEPRAFHPPEEIRRQVGERLAGTRDPDEAALLRAHRSLGERGIDTERLTGYEGEDFALGGDVRRDILAIAAVHPLRESAVRTLFEKAGADVAVLDELLASGELRRLDHAGMAFYIRSLHAT